MKLLNKLFPKKVEIEAVKSERDRLAEQNEALRQADTAYRQREREHYQAIDSLKAELRTTREKLREQTDADLLLISQRIAAKIIEGGKPDHSDAVEQQRLMIQRQSLAGQMNAANQYGNGIFGGYAGGASNLLAGAFGFR